MIAFDNLTQEQREHLRSARLVWALVCTCQCGACRAMFNELQRICGDTPAPASELCPHGLPLADNICGPCSQGRPMKACKHEHGSGLMDTNGHGEFTCHDCGDTLVLGRGLSRNSGASQ